MLLITTIDQGHCRIIERFGKPVKVQNSGFAFRFPFIDSVKSVPQNWGRIANKGGYLIELTEQMTNTEPRECITRDNAQVIVDTLIRWRITDPIKAVYEIDDLLGSLVNAVLNCLRGKVGEMPLDEVLKSGQELSRSVLAAIASTTFRWGVSLVSIEIQELKVDDATSGAMLQQLAAERKSRAIVAEAEGQAAAVIRTAQAEKEATILRAQATKEALAITAEAEKDYLNRLASIVGAEAAAKILLTSKVVDGYSTISSNPASKVFIPSNVSGIINYDSK